jgi:hypothetical protein
MVWSAPNAIEFLLMNDWSGGVNGVAPLWQQRLVF